MVAQFTSKIVQIVQKITCILRKCRPGWRKRPAGLAQEAGRAGAGLLMTKGVHSKFTEPPGRGIAQGPARPTPPRCVAHAYSSPIRSLPS